MNFKKLLASLLTASMLVTSMFSNVGLTSVNANDSNTTEVKENDKEYNTDNKFSVDTPNSDVVVDDKSDLTNNGGVINGQEAVKNEDKDANAKEEDLTTPTDQNVSFEEVDRDELDVDLHKNETSLEFLNESTVSADDMVNVIIVVDGDSILDGDANATLNFINKIKISFMEMKQDSIISNIENKVLEGEDLAVRYQYTWLLNGIATQVPYGTIDEIEALDGVKDVVLQPVYELDTEEETDPNTVSDGVMIGRDDTWASGYTGEGMKIAIVDTGIDDDHQNFQAMDESKLTEDSATKESISAVLDQLNASYLFDGLVVDNVYRSNKIAYGFNYVDGNVTINHDSDYAGDHGTHVAGIAAANDLGNGEAVGTAPDAQLYVMKVFGANGGAYVADYLAAIEDAMLLDADVVNLSLGSPAGFTTDGDWVDSIFEKVAETGTVLTISAGNSYTMGYGNLWGTNESLASNPDNGVVGSPGTYQNVTTVGSIENVAVRSYYLEVNGKKFGYEEGSNAYNDAISTIAGQELEFVYVENFGQTLDDFLNAGVEGKVAVVQRGISTFVSKIEFAEQAGAVACIVFNNVSGSFGMDLTDMYAYIPAASVSMEAGEFMVSSLQEGVNTLTFSTDQADIANDLAWQMSDFSSWGATGDLTIGVDITGPGGNIYSTLDDGQYGIMSGTSMSSPNVAGLMALVMQYLKETYPQMPDTDVRVLANSLLMSTAEIIVSPNGITYSPRQQGAGLANAYYAINTNTYLSVDGKDAPKAELGDDPERTGVYTYTFNVHNFGDTNTYYDINTLVQTEEVLDYYGYKFMGGTPIELSANTSATSDGMILSLDYNEDGSIDVRDARVLYDLVLANEALVSEVFNYDLNGDNVVDTADVQLYLDMLVDKDVELAVDPEEEVLKVSAGETVQVTVSVEVSDEGKAYMDENFENGIYVEGFTVLSPLSNGAIELSLPFMGFYGDWTEAPILDYGYYYDDSMYDAYHYYNILWTEFGGETYTWAPGYNPYFDEEIIFDYISLSPNGDGYSDTIYDAYVSLLRNAGTLTFTYTNTETGEVLFEEVVEHVSKSYYSTGNGLCVPYVYSWYSYPYDLTDENGDVLPNNTKVSLTIKAELDYDKHESNNESDTWVTNFTIDLEAPELLHSEIKVLEDGTQLLGLQFKDNVATAGVNFLNKSGTMVLSQVPVDHEAEENGDMTWYDVTGFGDKFYVVLGDYACNESAYLIKTDNNAPVLNTKLLYGYRVGDDYYDYYGDSIYGWLGIDKEDADISVLSSEWYMDFALTSAEYVGGYILATDADYNFLVIKPGYWDERTVLTNLGMNVRDMAWDPTTNTLYAIAEYYSDLYTIDITTGEATLVAYGSDNYSYRNMPKTITIDDEGNMYGMSYDGNLQMIDKTTNSWTGDVLYSSGYYLNYAQSMTFDSATDSIYWASYIYSYYGSMGNLIKFDTTNEYAMTDLGTIGGNSEVVGLLALDNKGYTIPTDEPLVDAGIQEEVITMLENTTETLTVELNPWYGAVESIEWSVADETVATVDEDGIVTAKAVGTTTVTLMVNGQFSDTCEIKVVNPNANVNGYVIYSVDNALANQWINVDADDLSYDILTEGSTLTLYSAEYVNGTIYGYSSAGEFYKIDAETREATKISGHTFDYQVLDMAYDYSTGLMYALTLDFVSGSYYNLVNIDLNTGATTIVATDLFDKFYNPQCALAISTDGTIYTVSYTGYLHTWDAENGLVELGYLGASGSQYIQSMTYDHNSEDGGIYWAMCSNTMEMMYIDIETHTALSLGTIDSGVEMTSTFIIPDADTELPVLDEVAVESVTMLNDTVKVLTGSSSLIDVEVYPYNATDRNVEWVVADETIAQIKDGKVYGLTEGTTTATGTLAGFEVTINIEVIESAGKIVGSVMFDAATYSGDFWGSFYDNDLSSGKALSGAVNYSVYAGAYYDGKIYGYGMDNETYESIYVVINAYTYQVEKMIPGDYPDVMDMAFDYSKGVMYAVAGQRNVYGNNAIYAVDLETGLTFKEVDLPDQVMTLACTTDGILYGVGMYGSLYSIDTNADYAVEYIGETGQMANCYQSMAYDHNTGNLYWAQYYNDPWAMSTNGLFIVDTEDASLFNLGLIGTNGCEVSAMYIEPKQEIAVGTPEISGISLNKATYLLQPEETVQINATALPVSVTLKDTKFTYTSSNPEVVSVDENGLVTALTTGDATITIASENGISATCIVKVRDNSTKLHVVNAYGWETSPLLDPTTIESSVEISDIYIEHATYSNGYFYAIDYDGYLWKFTEDLTTFELVLEEPLYTTFENLGEYAITCDITFSLDGEKIYLLGEHPGMYYWEASQYYMYELDLETGVSSVVAYLSDYLYTPKKIECIGDNKFVVYDYYDDYIYTVELDETTQDALVEQLLWVQDKVSCGDYLGMTYSKDLDLVFLSTSSFDWTTYTSTMALFMLDHNSKEFEKVSDAAYNMDMRDLVLIEE